MVSFCTYTSWGMKAYGVEAVSSTSRETTNTNRSGTATDSNNVVGSEGAEGRTPGRTRLNSGDLVVLVVLRAVHVAEVDSDAVLDRV